MKIPLLPRFHHFCTSQAMTKSYFPFSMGKQRPSSLGQPMKYFGALSWLPNTLPITGVRPQGTKTRHAWAMLTTLLTPTKATPLVPPRSWWFSGHVPPQAPASIQSPPSCVSQHLHGFPQEGDLTPSSNKAHAAALCQHNDPRQWAEMEGEEASGAASNAA